MLRVWIYLQKIQGRRDIHILKQKKRERYTEKGHAEITRRRERDILYRGDIITIHLLSLALRLRPKTTTFYTKVLQSAEKQIVLVPYAPIYLAFFNHDLLFPAKFALE